MESPNSILMSGSLIETEADDVHDHLQISRPDEETVPFMLRVNYAFGTPNVRAILSNFTRASLFLSLAMYGHFDEEMYLFIGLLVDFICNVIGFRYLMRYPETFRTDRNNFLVPAMIAEKTSFFLRGILTIVLIISYYLKVPALGWLFFAISIMLVGSTHLLGQSMAYSSIYNLVLLLTLDFVMLKIHCDVNLDWRVVFWFQRAFSWLCVPAGVGYLIFWMAISVKKLQSTTTASWASVGFNSAWSVVLIIESSVIFYLQDFLEKPTALKEKSLFYVALITAFSHLIYLILGLMMCDCLVFRLSFEENVIVKKGLSYEIRVIQVTANSFIQSSSNLKSLRTGQAAFPKKVACFVCKERRSDCLALNCMHSGVCQTCALPWLKINHLCPACQVPIDKLVVLTDLESPTEYLVTTEMTRME